MDPALPTGRSPVSCQPSLSFEETNRKRQSNESVNEPKRVSSPEVVATMEHLSLDDIKFNRESLDCDLFQVETREQFDNLLYYCQTRCAQSEISIIQHPSDIDDNGLLKDVVVREDGERSWAEPVPGPLFRDKPTTLIIDCRTMNSAQLAELNQLLDREPRMDNLPISKSCQRVIVVNRTMQAKKGCSNAGQPGGDFWRRVSRSENSWDVPETATKPLFFHLARVEDRGECESVDRVVLDFHQDEWRKVLFGAPVLNKNGQVSYQHSLLTRRAQGYQAGHPPIQVVLKGAPDHDPSFVNAISQILLTGGYQANGEPIDTTPIEFLVADREQDQQRINRLKTAIAFQPMYQSDFTNINSANLEEYLAEVTITDGRAVAGDNLATIKGINITSPLSLAQWQRLLQRLHRLRPGHDPLPVCLFHGTDQPVEICADITDTRLLTPRVHLEVPSHVTVISVEDEEEQSFEIRQRLLGGEHHDREPSRVHAPGLHEVMIEPETTQAMLVGQLDVNSLQQRRFTAKESSLVSALAQGQTVLLRNLHSNPTLQQQLEGLLQNPPALVINGQRRTFPNARISITLPDDQFWSSSLWKTVVPITDPWPLEAKQRSLLKRLERLYAPLITAKNLPLNQIQSLLSTLPTIPQSPQKAWPYPAPKLSSGVMMKLAREVVRLCQADGSCESQPKHWRHALQTVILGEYRGCANVFNFISTMLEQLFPLPAAPGAKPHQASWVDQQALQGFLEQHNYRIDTETIRQNFWTLLPSLAPGLQPVPIPRNFANPGADAIELLAKYLYACCPEAGRSTLLKTLELNHWDLDPQTLTEPEPMDTGTPSTEQWLQQRLDQVTELVQHHPLVLLRGPAGGGKTYTAQQAAQALNPSALPVTISAGPKVSQETLMQQQQVTPFLALTLANLDRLQQHLGPKEVELIKQLADDPVAMEHGGSDQATPIFTLCADTRTRLSQQLSAPRLQELERAFHTLCDTRTETVAGPILRWANTQSRDGQPVTLIIDEANLAPAEFWHLFRGLNGTPPYLYYGGETIPLSPYHRVIMTGNLDNAPGRNTPAFLRELGVTLFFPSWTDQQLREAIILPRLAAMTRLEGVDHHRWADHIQALIQRLTSLLPDGGADYSPRDMHELCDRISLALEDADADREPDLGAIIWQACRETFAGTLSVHDPAITTLATWFREHNPADTLPGTGLLSSGRFEEFYQSLTSDRQFTFAGESVEYLARQYWSAIRKVHYEQRIGETMAGRHGTLVQSPPGRGKDQLLTRMLAQAKTKGILVGEPIHLNGGVSSWESVREALRLAAREGRVIIISELNLLPSQFLEQELNPILTGSAAPGFYLFATVNPTGFSGRQMLSPALASRFSGCQIGDYTDTELHTIASHALPENRAQAQQLADWHCNLRYLMVQEGLSHVVPSTSDLMAVINRAAQYPLSDIGVKALFRRQYRAYLDMAGCTWEALEEQQQARQDRTIRQAGECQARQQILTDLYRIFPELPPITLGQGGANTFDSKVGELTLGLPLQHRDALESAVLTVLNNQWQQQLPKAYPARHDTLAKALYLGWQKGFFLKQLDTRPDLARFREAIVNQFTLDDESKTTLECAENQPFIAAIQTLLEEGGYQPDLVLLRAFMGRLANPLAQSDLESATEPMETPSLKVQWRGADVVLSPRFSESGRGETFAAEKIFDIFDYQHNRMYVYQPLTSNILQGKKNHFGTLGYNSMHTEPLAEGMVKTPAQIYGEMTLKAKDATNGWHTLCGITDHPQARLTHLTLTPEVPFELLQDRGTGLYLIRLHLAEPDTEVDVRMIYDTRYERGTELPNLSFTHWNSCPQALAEPIDNCQELAGLRTRLKQAVGVKQQLGIIDDFLDSKFLLQPLNLSGCTPEQVIQKLLTESHCNAQSRALAFWLLARYCGIPVRIIQNCEGLYRVEISDNGGLLWKPHELPTFAHNSDKGEESKTREDFDSPEEQEIPHFTRWSNLNTCTPERVRYYMDHIPLSSEHYHPLARGIPYLIGKTASRDGEVSIERIKEWLNGYQQWLADRVSPPSAAQAIFAYMANLTIKELFDKFGKNPEADLVAQELIHYFIAQGVKPGHFSGPLHKLLFCQQDSSTRVKALEQARATYYSQLLTHQLEPGKDFYWPDPEHRFIDKGRFHQETLTEVKGLLGSAHSDQLNRLLYGELPGIQYRSTPPGVIDPVRLIRQKPSFQTQGKTIAPKQALFTVPIVDRSSRCTTLIRERLGAAAHNPAVDCSKLDQEFLLSRYFVRASTFMGTLLAPYIREAFIAHLYQSSRCHGQEPRILFPTEQRTGDPKSHQKAYYPSTIGWIVPRDGEDFYKIAQMSGSEFADNPGTLMREEWLKRAYNDPKICLLEESVLERCLECWLDSIDWPGVINRLKTLPFFISAKEREDQNRKEEAEEEADDARMALARMDKDPDTDKTSSVYRNLQLIANAGGGVVDDLI